MDNIENVLYLAIAIIYFLYRAFGKRKGKAQRQVREAPPSAPTTGPVQTSHPPKTKPLTFEDILRELAGEEQPVEIPVEPETPPEEEVVYEYEEEAEKEVTLEELPSYRTEVQAVSGSHLASTEGGRLNPFKIQKKTSKLHKDIYRTLSSLEGAKKAFILKEIFERKY